MRVRDLPAIVFVVNFCVRYERVERRHGRRDVIEWRLDGYRVLITGSTKGIGFAAAKEFIDLGAEVMVNGRNGADVKAAVARLGKRAYGCVADVATPDGRDALLSEVSSHWDGLDCLVNNAGTNVRKPALEATPGEYSRIVGLNMDAVYHLCVGAHPLLARSSRPTIVNVASAAGLLSTGSGAAYAVSKAGVVQLTKTLACEWAPKIRVNCVAPWVTWTPLLANRGGRPRDTNARLAQGGGGDAAGRCAMPEEMARRFVSSPWARRPSPADARRGGGCCARFAGACVTGGRGGSIASGVDHRECVFDSLTTGAG